MPRQFPFFVLLVGVIAAVLDSCAHTPLRSGIRLDTGSAAILISPDIGFVIRSAQEAAAGIEIGKLAASNGVNPATRALGEEQVNQYAKLQDQLVHIVEGRGITLPTTPAITGIQARDKLTRLSGTAFDKAYLKDTLKSSENQAARFAKEAKSGMDPQIQDFAEQTAPKLEGMAEKIKSMRAQAAGGPSI